MRYKKKYCQLLGNLQKKLIIDVDQAVNIKFPKVTLELTPIKHFL